MDDHVIEPPDLWQRELPASLRAGGPRVVRERVKLGFMGGKMLVERDVPDGTWCDVWLYDDLVLPMSRLYGAAGFSDAERGNAPTTYDEFRPGTWLQKERLADMDTNHVQVSINYPNTFPRFAGQGFAERADKEMALACLRVYNDWTIDEWCGGDAGRGRLVPLTLVPLWDAGLAAEEVRRCMLARAKPCAIAFTWPRTRRALGLPSLYTGYWDPVWAACEETDTTVSMHIGSSSSMPTTSPDAPLAVSMSLNAQNAQGSVCDWVFSKSLMRFPLLQLAYAESQVGWMPFQLERMDAVWREDVGGVELAEPPSTYVKGRIYGCIFDDLHGLKSREAVGMDYILFEADFPHANGTWPDTRAVAHRLCSEAGMDADECFRLLRRNAVVAYGLERFGISA